jgi:hypothetical protein
MFVETKREGEAPVKEPKFMTLESLVAWLETKNPAKTYCYTESGHCLIAQYMQAHGYSQASCGPWAYCLGPGMPRERMPNGFNEIAIDDGRTFGEALERAKAWIR